MCAVLVGGVVGALAVYTLGRDDSSGDRGPRTYTVRQGDVVVAPAASTRCEASAEGGFPNLICNRTQAGRYQVIFYSDSVLVWDLRLGPDGPPKTFPWAPR